MKWIALLTVTVFTVLLIIVTPAPAQTTLVGPAKRAWMDRCLAKSSVISPQLTLTVYRSKKNGRSYIAPWEQRVWLDDLDSSFNACYILRHEIGHLFDWFMLQSHERRYLSCRIIGQPSPNPWWSYWDGKQAIGGEGEISPLEQFAEAYAVAATVKRPRPKQPTGLMVIGYNTWDYLVDQRLYLRYQKIKRMQRYLNSRKQATVVDEGDRRRALEECKPG